MKKFSIAPLFLAPFLACGGGGGGTHVTVDGHTGSGSGSGSGSAVCKAPASYSGAFGSNTQQDAQSGSAGDHEKIAYLANLTGANPIDLLDIEIWAGSTDFPTAATTGTYDFSLNDNLNYLTCGACAAIYPQVPVGSDGMLNYPTGYFDTETYEAVSGTITITSVGSGSAGSGTFAGSLSNVKFDRHVFMGSGSASTETDPGDCSTTISSVNFSATLTPAMANAAVLAGTTDSGATISVKLHNRHR